MINKSNYTTLQKLLSQIIFNWAQVEKLKLNYEESREIFQNISPKYKNIKRINNVFLSCYFDSFDVENKFQNLIKHNSTDFSRYTFFYVNYLLKKDYHKKANLVLIKTLNDVPRNLLLNQLYSDIQKEKQNYLQNKFNCKNVSNIIAELFYITANALSTQNLYSLSNFYINFSKILKPEFFFL